MTALPDADALRAFLDRVRRRLLLLRAGEGIAAGAVGAAFFVLLGVRAAAPLAALVAGATILRVLLGETWKPGWWQRDSTVARQAERRAPEAKNLIVTASELEPATVSSYVPRLVVAHAARIARRLDPAVLFPARPVVLLVLGATLLLAGALWLPASVREVAELRRERSGDPVVRGISVTITSPAYAGLAEQTLSNPARIEALASSRIELQVDAVAAEVLVHTVEGVTRAVRGSRGFTVTLPVTADGFVAVEPRDSAGVAGPRYIASLVVTPDHAPQVALTSPGRDLFFSTVPSTIPVAMRADDDIALSSLVLRFTAVSGSGERFTFTERDVPVSVRATTPQSWTATGTWRLDELQLAPGDMLVYRAVATDRRPGAAPVESERFVIEVVTPGAVAAEGFAADDTRERYAASQQMIILKTERLIARQASLPRDSVLDAALLLAAEQRQVRAEFVFMMGGDLHDHAEELSGTTLVDEVAEAEAESDLREGRLQNQGRVDMMRAIRAMSRASVQLTDVNLEQALRDERIALENLMRAFARSRFILRALTQRERIDLDRRLSGTLDRATGLSTEPVRPEPPRHQVLLRRILADVAALASTAVPAGTAERAVSGAVDLERNGGTDSLDVVRRVQQLVARSGTIGARSGVDSLLRDLTRLLAATLPAAPRPGLPLPATLLTGAHRDALRQGARP